jgi:hypothetical protein
MTGDHHGQVVDTATLLVTATDKILGTHSYRVVAVHGYGVAGPVCRTVGVWG